MKFRDATLIPDDGQGSRELAAYVPEPVKLGKIPGWLSRLLVKQFKIPRDVPGGMARLYWVQGRTDLLHWIDHSGVVVIGNEQCFVSEPYGLSSKNAAALVEFCRITGLEFEVSAASNWFPTACLRITIRQPQPTTASETAR